MHPPFYALLVGIDHYASSTVPDLGGCVNDLTAMGELLQTKFGVPAAHITTLSNAEATLDNIKAAFRRHLLEPVRNCVQAQQVGSAPAVLFHFSGHGSQATDPTGQKPNGLDETLVCHDSRLPGIFDLKDWELGQLLDEVGHYTDNITVILDCCHSGSGTRFGSRADQQRVKEKPVANVRGCDTDRRTQPLTSRHALGADAVRSEGTAISQREDIAETGEAGTMGGRTNHVLLAACLNKEKAYEYVPPQATHTDDSTLPRAQRHGALTYYLLQALTELDAAYLPTYYELYEQLRPKIANRFPQTIQCEGDWGRVIFGTARPDRNLWLTIVEQRGTTYVVNGGAVHGITVGTRFHIYSPAARTVDDAGPRLGTLEAVRVGVAQSDCYLIAQEEQIPLHARLEPELATLLSQRRTLAVDVRYTQIATAVRERLAQADVAPLIALRNDVTSADFRLTLLDRDFVILSAAGGQLGPHYPMHELNPRRRPFAPADFDPIADALKRIVRVQEIEVLENLGSPLADAITITVKQLVRHSAGDADHPVQLPTSADDLPLLSSGVPFVVEVINQYLDALYIGVLLIGATWTVEQLYPDLHGTHVMLASGNTLRVGMEEWRTQPLMLTLNSATVADHSNAGETVTLLVIATKEVTDFESLLQREEALAERLRLQLQNTKRDFRFVPEIDPEDEWLIKRLRLQVVPSPH